MKPYFPILVILLLVSSSYIGVSNTAIESEMDIEQPMQTSGPPMDSPWPMKCHDTHHTGRSPYSTADNSGDEKWRFRSMWDGSMESSAIIDNEGIIYFGTMGTDCRLYAVYPNGTKKWNYNLANLIWSTPAIAEDGTIYVGSYDAKLHALYSNNGTLKWTIGGGGSISSSPAIAEDGTIYFGAMGPGNNGRINAINPNGTRKWEYNTGYWIVSDPAIGDDGTIYIGSGDNYLYALYPNGTLRWRFKTGDDIKGHPSIAEDGTIYIPSIDGYLYALYPNGTMKWKVKTGYGAISSAVIAEDGTVYISTTKLYAIYPNNGTVKWSIDVGGDNSHPSPAISGDGTIYVSTGNRKHLVAVNPDGIEKWRKKLCDVHARSSPCIGKDGTIYVGSTSENPPNHFRFSYLHAFGELDPNAPFGPDIDGQESGKIEEEYQYTFTTTDPNGDDVYYWIEWGDGKIKDWIGPYPSGGEITVNHTYKEKGTYTIRARAKDTDNLWGPWSELEVTMPKTYNPLWWFSSLLDRFPLMNKLFSLLMDWRSV